MHQIPLQIRKHSWWTSAGPNKRTFMIAELHYGFDDSNVLEYHCVGLLEYAVDYPIYLDIKEFVRLFDAGDLIPVNESPVLPKGHDRPPQPDFSPYLPAPKE